MKAHLLIFSIFLVILISIELSASQGESTSDQPGADASSIIDESTISTTIESSSQISSTNGESTTIESSTTVQSASSESTSASNFPNTDSTTNNHESTSEGSTTATQAPTTDQSAIPTSTSTQPTSISTTSQPTSTVSSTARQSSITTNPSPTESTTTTARPNNEVQVTIDCTIAPVVYIYFGRLTSCRVDSNPYITSPDSTVVKVRSTSGGSISNAKVFYALSKTIRYIPKQLSTYLTDLTGIRLENTQLQSVTSCDLVNFPKLTMFASVHNNVEFLEKNLFKNNPNIEFVSFQFNRLSYIEPTVFNPIKNNLHHLYLYSQNVPCLLGNAITKAGVSRILSNLPKSKCADSANEPLSYILWTQGGSVCN